MNFPQHRTRCRAVKSQEYAGLWPLRNSSSLPCCLSLRATTILVERRGSTKTMNKRDFLKSSGAIVAGSMISRLAPSQQQPAPRENWSGNITYSTDHVHTPANVEEVRAVVKSCSKLRALGSRHSFNRIADSTQNQVSLQHFDQIEIDDKARTVTVGAGVKYGQLGAGIDALGLVLHKPAVLRHIWV